MNAIARSIRAGLARLIGERQGNVAIIFGLALIPVLGTVGVAVDYSRASNARSFLQNAADSAALTALSKFEVEESARKKFAEDNFAAQLDQSNAPISAVSGVTFSGETATVTASTTVETTISGIFNVATLDVAVTSTAQQAPKVGPVCVLALDPAAAQAIDVDGTADLSAGDCVVHANSRSDTALNASGSTSASADTFCAVGGHSGDNFTPDPIKHCSVAADPFAGLPTPSTAGCNYTNTTLTNGTHSLLPGVYCGGLTLNAGAVVTLAAGLYVMKDGALTTRAGSTITGTAVTVYLTGDDAVLDIKSNSNVDLTAPTTGDYAGMVFIQDANASAGETSSIEGGGTLRIVGATYLPTQLLKVGGGGEIGLNSPYMPLVAQIVKFHGNAQITINTDAGAVGFPDVLPDVRAGTPRLIN